MGQHPRTFARAHGIDQPHSDGCPRPWACRAFAARSGACVAPLPQSALLPQDGACRAAKRMHLGSANVAPAHEAASKVLPLSEIPRVANTAALCEWCFHYRSDTCFSAGHCRVRHPGGVEVQPTHARWRGCGERHTWVCHRFDHVNVHWPQHLLLPPWPRDPMAAGYKGGDTARGGGSIDAPLRAAYELLWPPRAHARRGRQVHNALTWRARARPHARGAACLGGGRRAR